jgi:hypothetical protein
MSKIKNKKLQNAELGEALSGRLVLAFDLLDREEMKETR